MRGHLQHRGGDAWQIKVYLGRSPECRRRYLERIVRGSRRDAKREMSARTIGHQATSSLKCLRLALKLPTIDRFIPP